MAINIIKRGKLPSEDILKSTCNRCKSELEFTSADGEMVHDPRDGGVTVTVKCPVCGGNVHGYPRNS